MEAAIFDNLYGMLVFPNAKGIPLATVERLVSPTMPAQLVSDDLGEERFAFGRTYILIWGHVIDGHVQFMELQRAHNQDGPRADELDAAARALVAIGKELHLTLKSDRGGAIDLADENRVRDWLGAPRLPDLPDDAIEKIYDAIHRGEKVDERFLPSALLTDEADTIVKRLLPMPDDFGKVPFGTRDILEVSKFSMTFSKWEIIGVHLTQYANAARKRFVSHGLVPRTVAGARACLYVEWRRRILRKAEDDWRWIDALLLRLALEEQIRTSVATDVDKYVTTSGDRSVDRLEVIEMKIEKFVTVRFVFDIQKWEYAQSGSDFWMHYVFEGAASFELPSLRLLVCNATQKHWQQVQESEEDTYDWADVLRRVRLRA